MKEPLKNTYSSDKYKLKCINVFMPRFKNDFSKVLISAQVKKNPPPHVKLSEIQPE